MKTDGPNDLTPDSGGMLVSREEMRFDFGEAKFRLPEDAQLLGWIFDQFLYGEVTGIQCGHWLHHAPNLEAATFFARQAVEELGHVRQFLRLYALLGVEPKPAHPVVRFLSTGAMGVNYAEHVATEMAVGEGLVLMVFYALIDTIDEPRVVKILESAIRQEERHVAFGEQQTMRLIAERPKLADTLLGLTLTSVIALRRLGKYVQSRLGPLHPVLAQSDRFLQRTLEVLELRLQRMGVLRGRLDELSFAKKTALVASAQARHFAAKLERRQKPLTSTYLSDPILRSAIRSGLEDSVGAAAERG